MITENRCERSDLLVSECAHCRDVDLEESDPSEFYFGAITRKAQEQRTKETSGNRPR